MLAYFSPPALNLTSLVISKSNPLQLPPGNLSYSAFSQSQVILPLAQPSQHFLTLSVHATLCFYSCYFGMSQLLSPQSYILRGQELFLKAREYQHSRSTYSNLAHGLWIVQLLLHFLNFISRSSLISYLKSQILLTHLLFFSSQILIWLYISVFYSFFLSSCSFLPFKMFASIFNFFLSQPDFCS